MTHVTYNVNTTAVVKYFDTASSAKRSATVTNKNNNTSNIAFTDIENYRANIVTKKTVINLLTGAEVEIDSNTPRCCDPSSELYWSM